MDITIILSLLVWFSLFVGSSLKSLVFNITYNKKETYEATLTECTKRSEDDIVCIGSINVDNNITEDRIYGVSHPEVNEKVTVYQLNNGNWTVYKRRPVLYYIFISIIGTVAFSIFLLSF